MPSLLPLHFLLLAVTGWANRQQAEAIAYLVAENRILRSKLPKRVSLTPQYAANQSWSLVTSPDLSLAMRSSLAAPLLGLAL